MRPKSGSGNETRVMGLGMRPKSWSGNETKVIDSLASLQKWVGVGQRGGGAWSHGF